MRVNAALLGLSRRHTSEIFDEITAALIERSQLVRGWLECAARCECPSLDECALFVDPARLPRSPR